MRSTLSFAREEKYKTRAVLVSLYRERQDILGAVDVERQRYGQLCGDLAARTSIDCAATLSERLRNELIRVVLRMEKVEETP